MAKDPNSAYYKEFLAIRRRTTPEIYEEMTRKKSPANEKYKEIDPGYDNCMNFAKNKFHVYITTYSEAIIPYFKVVYGDNKSYICIGSCEYSPEFDSDILSVKERENLIKFLTKDNLFHSTYNWGEAYSYTMTNWRIILEKSYDETWDGNCSMLDFHMHEGMLDMPNYMKLPVRKGK